MRKRPATVLAGAGGAPVTPAGTPVTPSGDRGPRGQVLARPRGMLPGGWPLVALYLAFPLWWVLGLSEVIFILIAIPMAARLFRQRPIRLPRGFGLWLLFLLWVVVGVLVLQVTAPGSIPEPGSFGRYLTFTYRLLVYMSATVFLVYVGNLPEDELSTVRVLRLLGFMFVVTVVGGLVGTFAARVEFTSPVEYLLPGALRANGFVRALVHPRTAELASVLGREELRPVAPFPYANSWGANFSFFLPFFLLSWLGKGAGWRRWVAPVVLVAALIPVVYSLNRGLWAAIGVGLVYVAVRLAMMGKVMVLQGILVGLVVAGVLFLASPLSSLVSERLDNPHSNERRSQLSSLTVISVWEGSPVIGYGTTRKVQGSFASIAGGETARCPRCGVPPLGTQGTLWAVLFFQGIVGAALYFSFFAVRFLRHRRDRWPVAVAGCAVLTMAVVEMFVYDFGTAFFTIMIVLGLMWRREQQRAEAAGVAA